ncbi:LuxR C-terminal-related transcriptional regulator [Serratia marcescens]|uniref:LuxR C-terminal-related transcriptional regulator n=1 Tax=Serratia marcescens TaxID=615 RepID=UPI003896D275
MNKKKNSTPNKEWHIVIIDDDKFYASGLAIVLEKYLNSIGQSTVFSFHYPCKKKADIVFQAIRCGTVIVPRNPSSMRNDKPLYVAIAEIKDAHLKHLYKKINKNNILYRHQSEGIAFQLMENILSKQLMQRTPVKAQPNQTSFTQREREVLHLIKQGKTLTCMSACLGINVKTISAHKRNAMKKLNFKRNQELFHWLLQSDLTSHQSRKGNSSLFNPGYVKRSI